MGQTLVLLTVLGGIGMTQHVWGENLALKAQATASESLEDMTPDKAVDGDPGSRWSAIPGHIEGNWFELAWDDPVTIAEVVVRQYDRWVTELDVQVWDADTGDWRAVGHLGTPGERLPMAIASRFEPQRVSRLRIGSIRGGPSFTEIEVHERPYAYPLTAAVGSDLDGGIVGIVCDERGAMPIAGARVTLSGRGRTGDRETHTQSDDRGLFFAKMPLGLRGQVRVTAQIEGNGCEVTADVAQLPYGLTPAPPEPERTDLCGDWLFCPDPPDGFWERGFDDSGWQDIAVPAHWVMQGFESMNGVGGYRRSFEPPEGDGRLKLGFDGVYSGAEVWVNGERLAYHEGGATPFEADITDAVHAGPNVLALRVTEHTVTSNQLDKMSYYAYFPLAGIMRKVYLFRVPAAHIGGVALATRFDPDYHNAVIEGRVAVVNESGEQLPDASVRFELRDPEGRKVQVESARSTPLHPPLVRGEAGVAVGAWERADVEFSLPVTAPRKWDAEHPNLYSLTIQLRSGDRLVQTHTQQLGFRQTEIRGSEILINGSPVKLRGTCHHDAHPTMGRAVTAKLTRRDLELMKEANLNAVRTSHYPPIQELLDIADELGLYVEDEGPFCWVGASDDLRLTPRMIQLEAEMLARDRNHPSVFMWSLGNESRFGYGFERAHDWVRRSDPTRPTAAGTSADLEIATLHNPLSIDRMDQTEALDRPLLFDESLCIYQGIFGDVGEMWVDPGIRDYYVEPLRAVYERFMRSRATQGSFIWCWGDDIFCVPDRGLEYGRGATRSHFVENCYRLPGRGLTGDAPWGVIDGWRRPKPEFWIAKKLHSPVKVKEGPIPLPASEEGEKGGTGTIRVGVENQYDFTNLSELDITWEIGDESGTVAADVPPRSVGELVIRPERAPQAGETLALTFTDAAGRMVDSYRLPLGEPAPHRPMVAGAEPKPLRIIEEDTLGGPGTQIAGNGFHLVFHKGGGAYFDPGIGYLRACVAFGEPLLLELPSIHLLPSGVPQRPMPDPLTWTGKSMDIRPDGPNVRITIKGSYDGFEGGYDLVVTPSGEITVHAAFTYSGEDVYARETGLRVSVPLECDLLQWDRNAEWRVYPDDHIGRPTGSARPVAEHRTALPPVWPWSEDNSAMGCNDFRSTKRHINWAAIGYPDGPAVLVESDGSQSARAMVQSDRISLYINDWYGGTGAGLWEWVSNYGKGKLVRKGDVIESTVRLRLAGSVEAP
jgi:beta-galactosidase